MPMSFLAAADPVRPVRPDDRNGTAAAVVVDGTANLAHTRQILPGGADGKYNGPDSVDGQIADVLGQLESAMREAHSGFERLVKVDVYLARLDALGPFQKVFGRRIGTRSRPAISYVVGALPRPESAVALDAIFVTPLMAPGSLQTFTVLPAGSKVYISGQAEPASDLGAATRKTLDSLDSTLKFVGLDRSRVVRLKAFVQPMSPESAAVVERELSIFFNGKRVPPFSLVEWRLSPSQPIEIEVIAAGREPGDSSIEYLAPPALKPSPVFSRVARLGAGPIIYVSSLYGTEGTSGTAQVEAIFGTLTDVLAESGSDLRHLAKATYYVSDGAASRALGDLRPRYFDPMRPPAASKAFVAGVGLEGRTVTLDMIAVPAAK